MSLFHLLFFLSLWNGALLPMYQHERVIHESAHKKAAFVYKMERKQQRNQRAKARKMRKAGY